MKGKTLRGRSPPGQRSRTRAKATSVETVRISRIFPNFNIAKHNRVAHSAKSGSSRTQRLTQEKWWKRICCLIEEFQANGLRIPRYRAAEIQVYPTEEHKILGIKAQRSFLKWYASPSKKSARKGPSQGVLKCQPHERGPYASKFEDRTQEETLQQERCARREAWDLAINVHKLFDRSLVTTTAIFDETGGKINCA